MNASSQFCTANSTFGDDYEAGHSFSNTRAINFAHHASPRFGRGSELSVLINGSPADRRDYLVGLSIAVILLLLCFLVWTTTICFLKARGADKVNGWSGEMRKMPHKPCKSACKADERSEHAFEEDCVKWKQQHIRQKRRFRVARWANILACLVLITSATLMSIKGVSGMSRTLYSSLETLDHFQRLLNEAIVLMDDLLGIKYVEEDNIAILLELEEAGCGRIPPLDPKLRFVVTVLRFKRNQFWRNMTQTRSDMEWLLDMTESGEQMVHTYDWAFQVARAFCVLLAFLCLLILLGVLCRLPNAMKFLQHKIVLPLFCFLVVITVILGLVFVLGSVTLADFCVDDPDTRVRALIEVFEEELSDVTYSYLLYYVDHCPVEEIPDILNNYINIFVTASEVAHDLANVDVPLLDSCDEAIAVLNVASTQFCSIADLLDDLGAFLRCSEWYPFLRSLTYETLCYAGTEGFAWVASTQIAILFAAMIVMTSRSAFYELEILDEKFEGDASDAEQESEGTDTIPMEGIKSTAAAFNPRKIDATGSISRVLSSESIETPVHSKSALGLGERTNVEARQVWLSTPVAEVFTALFAALVGISYAFLNRGHD